jgi:hypothetical protein
VNNVHGEKHRLYNKRWIRLYIKDGNGDVKLFCKAPAGLFCKGFTKLVCKRDSKLVCRPPQKSGGKKGEERREGKELMKRSTGAGKDKAPHKLDYGRLYPQEKRATKKIST